ncbi:S1C family serine protease [Streptomyces himalayensis]|uniref:Trypsin-like peptidase domain-containing protein n=1 Tax=Streptomyces himalayensis subsp. himalayensis TaxID=2756131 RepID=A0A7W0DME0_9ACTN|nr:trypsin-like peptidase domain-containing protein [Streptomyces himalayensis]MBA2947308.1 trypsin-like peptidase domain-containing protein [Streptomyces himalayensis subsp. himalayensis]
MTESIRRDGESQGDSQQSAYQAAPAGAEWPPPPAYDPAQPVAVAPGTTVWPGSGQDGHGGHDGNGTGGGYAYAAPAEPAPAPRRRAKGPTALLAAVAIAAAAVGGATAYAFQELTGKDVTTASSGTSVVPASKKGTVAGVAEAVSPSIVEISATSNAGQSTGSGVVITSDGEIITNNHVVSGASSIKVTTSNGKTYTANVLGTDSSKDLALIKLEDASGLKTASLGDSTDVKVGDEVVAIGSPEGLTGTVTSGIISALDRDVTVSTDESQGQQQLPGGGGGWPFEFGGQEFNGDTGSSTTTYKALQTDASLNPGNSGGALIDMNGNIIGINSAMYSPTSSSSSSSAGSVGLGFAIPINTVKSDLEKLRSGSES